MRSARSTPKAPPSAVEVVVEGRPPKSIPTEIFRTRGDLSPMEAIVRWLVLDEDGPRLTYQVAADLLGVHKGAVSTHVQRVREKTGKK